MVTDWTATLIAPELVGDARDVLVMAAVICVAWWLRRPVVAVVVAVAGRRGRPDAAAWWSNRNLTTALVDAGVLKARDGERLNVSYRGAPRTTDTGTTVTVALPQARTLSDVLARREYLAAALRVPTARLEVTQADTDPANVVTIRVGTDRPRQDVPATVTTAARTTWSDPVRVGADTHGRPVELATVEANTLVAGFMGAGKTSLARILMGHYLLDPTTALYVLDGKGSRRDYGHARPLCTRFVSGVDADAVADTLALLGEVFDIVQARNDSGDDGHPGLLVLLEEFQDVRAAADRAEREALDKRLGRVVRMGRAVSVHVLISTQRPSVEDLPSGTRNLLSQRVALRLRPGDATLVLGSTPTLPLPTRRGQALLATAGTQAVELDRLTEDAWRGLCARATALRATQTPGPSPVPVLTLAKPSQAITQPVPDPLDPFLDAITDALADMDPTGVTATDLHTHLPGWTHELVPTPRDLGVELRRWPATVERVNRGKSRVWRLTGPLTEHCRSTAGALPQPGPPTVGRGPVRAQVAASDSAGVRTARAGVDR